MQNKIKIIFHIDLNAFFATCASIKEPFLKNKAFAIGRGSSFSKGIISTASYEARKYGIRSGMSAAEALKLYPKLMIVPSDYNLYQKHSNVFFKVLKQYSNILLKASIDEGFLDVTDKSKTIHPLKLAREIQNKLLNEYQLPVSIGIGPTLFLAKMASDYNKPLGITIIRKKDVKNILYPLEINKMFGIGKKTYQKLNSIGIKTIKDFANQANQSTIIEAIGENQYYENINRLNGNSNDIVDPYLYDVPKSISNEITFNYAIDKLEVLTNELKELSSVVHNRLENEEMVAKTVSIKLKYADFTIITRSKTIANYSDDLIDLYAIAEELLETNYSNKAVRLIGYGYSNLIYKKELKEDYDLFNYQELSKREQLIYQTISSYNQKEGKQIIKKGIKKDITK